MDNEKETKFTAAVGFGSHSGWQEGDVDPASLGSSFYEGPTVSLTAGLTKNVVTAAINKTKKENRGGSMFEGEKEQKGVKEQEDFEGSTSHQKVEEITIEVFPMDFEMCSEDQRDDDEISTISSTVDAPSIAGRPMLMKKLIVERKIGQRKRKRKKKR